MTIEDDLADALGRIAALEQWAAELAEYLELDGPYDEDRGDAVYHLGERREVVDVAPL